MKSFIYRLPMKVTAIILSFFTLLITVGGTIGIIIMEGSEFYTASKDEIDQELLAPMLMSEKYDIIESINLGDLSPEELENKYSNSNIYYEISDPQNGIIYTNFPVDFSVDKTKLAENISRISIIFFSDGSTEMTTDEVFHYSEDYGDIVEEKYYDTKIYLNGALPVKDHYYYYSKLIDLAYSMRFSVLAIVFIALLVTVICWIYLICVAGRSSKNELALNPLDKIPFDLLVLVEAAILSILIALAIDAYDPEIEIISAVISCLFGYIAFSATVLSMATRIKTGVLFKNTVIGRILKALKRAISAFFRSIGYIISNINIVWKLAVGALLYIVFQLFLILVFQYNTQALFFVILISDIVLLALVLLIGIMLIHLKKGGERLANGEVTAQIDTSRMFSDFRNFGETLNNIGAGLQTALDERMKSERMKTELITNVSHDIKTPLTSIINYVDLIKKEEIKDEKTAEYIAVLDRQSKRLKKLIEDLVEASKASTGALKIDPRPCDVGVLLSQAVGEYNERFAASRLTTVLNIPEVAVAIMADGRYLWRVFDNLFNNICKYAMPDTRVYLDLAVDKRKARITFRNISASPLNISSDELMERFVRGDSSRNTEGSGLGLSIAKSLTELQNGQLELFIDGDLFKAVITFDKI